MTKSQMDIIMLAIASAYPNAFPKTKDEMQVVTMVWYADVGHLDYDLVGNAAAHMRKRCQWPSIVELWRSVLLICGLPDYFEVKQQIAAYIDKGSQKFVLSTLAKRVYDAYGTRYDHVNADKMYDSTLRKCYAEAVEWWTSEWGKPEHADLLLGIYNNRLQLTEGNKS